MKRKKNTSGETKSEQLVLRRVQTDKQPVENDENQVEAYHEPVPRENEKTAARRPVNSKEILPENELFLEVLGDEILLILKDDQLNLFGQTFRPIFCGKVTKVTNAFITLDPVIIKMTNAPFHRFPTPLHFPIEKVSTFTPFDCGTRLPLF